MTDTTGTNHIPRRRMGDDGKWIIEGPQIDSAAERQWQIKSLRKILTATWPNGRLLYTADLRELALQKLKELGEGDETL